MTIVLGWIVYIKNFISYFKQLEIFKSEFTDGLYYSHNAYFLLKHGIHIFLCEMSHESSTCTKLNKTRVRKILHCVDAAQVTLASLLENFKHTAFVFLLRVEAARCITREIEKIYIKSCIANRKTSLR